jgi:AcrR family transcriptional regulator
MPIADKYSGMDLRILESATELFSSHGYKGTTTREIAQLAMVSENSVFRHFQNKEGLFWAVLESRFSRINMRHELRESLRSHKSWDVVLPMLLEYLTYIVVYQHGLIRLLCVAFLELPEKAEVLCGLYISPIFVDVSHYLAKSSGKNELSAFESTLLAAAFVGSPIVHPLYHKLVSGSEPISLPEVKERVRLYTAFWLSVLNK